MIRVTVTDHALVRFLERAAGLDAEALRARIAVSLERAVAAADRIGESEYGIAVDGLIYIVRDSHIITVVPDSPAARVRAAGTGRRGRP